MMEPIKTKRLTEKILLEQTPNHIHVQFETPYQVISSAVLGGGFTDASHILNLKVAKQSAAGDEAFKAPDAFLTRYCQEHSWLGQTVGMMTAASMDSYRIVKAVEQGVEIAVLVTSGLSNVRRAGDYAEHRIGMADQILGGGVQRDVDAVFQRA